MHTTKSLFLSSFQFIASKFESRSETSHWRKKAIGEKKFASGWIFAGRRLRSHCTSAAATGRRISKSATQACAAERFRPWPSFKDVKDSRWSGSRNPLEESSGIAGWGRPLSCIEEKHSKSATHVCAAAE